VIDESELGKHNHTSAYNTALEAENYLNAQCWIDGAGKTVTMYLPV